MNFEDIRQQFPILTRQVYNKQLVYFDNAATTQKPQCVLDKTIEAYTQYNSNIHRGVHYLSQVATMAHEQARQDIADFIGAKDKKDIIFTRGTTEAINLVAFCFGETFIDEGDEIIVSAVEHHSNLVPWQMMCERKKAILRIIPLKDDCQLDLQAFENLLNERTKLVAVAHVSNVLGMVNPIETIISMAHKAGAKVLIDGAQSVAHTRVDVSQLDADFFAFSGHKIYGPTGIGILYGKENILNAMIPYQGGGEMIQHVEYQHTTYNELPYKFEAGTPDFIGSVGLSEALKFVRSIGIENIKQHETDLLVYALNQLNQIEGMKIIGQPTSGVISFNVGKIHPYDIGVLLDKQGVAVRTGHHCAEPLINLLGLPGTVRISFAIYNTKEEIDIMIKALKRAVAMLQ
ncbi:MAG: cysteine desulfurase [Paludibacteraceae bacterium]|nr:cysteine desulfurase [Paludibacteraceae bacterium]